MRSINISPLLSSLILLNIKGNTHGFAPSISSLTDASVATMKINNIDCSKSSSSSILRSLSADSSEVKSVDKLMESTLVENDAEIDNEWIATLQSKEIQDVRLELIKKYLEFGRTQEDAEAEVDVFLQNKEQSQQYIDMRRYAQAQKDGLGETFFTLGAAFVVGFGAQIGFKYYNAYQSFYPDGNGPVPFL
mmetsp:Transcript_27939/g.32211  ORF Transcript_27939/g.32211 Transcript_27939/m.32211 type:complete len:191 (-) Transcript_27939:644-1216(-)